MQKKQPRILIYKRTHTGDPDYKGRFGINDCMGKVRNRNYDAVIGLGGKRPWKGFSKIAYRLNWVGINPIKHKCRDRRGKLVTFSKFFLYNEDGLFIKDIAPKLYQYLYVSSPYRRIVMSESLSEEAYHEAFNILESAHKYPISNPLSKCRPKTSNMCKKPNHCMQLTAESVTSFAKRRKSCAPSGVS
jgi:hypothetical protein